MDRQKNIVRSCSLFVMVLALVMPCHAQSASESTNSLLVLYDENQSVSPKLQRVRTLIRANVLDLAQLILETEGPPSIANKAWINWERQLWKLYRIKGNWQGLYQRSRQIPPAFPERIRKEADVQAIYASIELNDGKKARTLLRKQLLSNDLLEFESRKFRKLLIESYLADDLLTDASVAMRNYQSDFHSEKEDWLLLRAKIHLKRDYPDFAANLLSSLNIPAAQLLRIFVGLKNQSLQPALAISRAEKLFASLESLSDRDAIKAYQILAVIIYATHSSDQLPPAVDQIEQYLIAIKDGISVLDNIYPRYSVSDLLAAYEATALDVARRFELKTDDWLNAVSRLPATEIMQKKAIYGYLLQNRHAIASNYLQQNKRSLQQLNDSFVTYLIRSNRIDVVSHVYGVGKPFGTLTLSGNVSLKLSDAALAAGNTRLAAEVNRVLTDIPHGMEHVDWLLRTVRISIIAGDYDKGVDDLRRWIVEFDQLESAQTNRILQPIFDLQTANQHKLALQLLHEVNKRSQSNRHKREIAYWIGQSYQATRQYIKAADYFLFSALQKDNGFDQWGESARYNAAEALLAANLVADSRVLFEGLLARATTDNRRTQLKQKLQQLWLHESSLQAVQFAQ